MSESQPWYKDGLKFTCTQCGNCCTGDPGVVWINDDELREIAEFLGKTVGEVRLMQTRLVGNRISLTEYANGDCVYFDGATRRCKIYPVRPRQCRSWPFWRSNLASPEEWSETCKSCPGAGHGELVPLEEIERRASLIDI
jgi:Fe-S-cluster containining protein